MAEAAVSADQFQLLCDVARPTTQGLLKCDRCGLNIVEKRLFFSDPNQKKVYFCAPVCFKEAVTIGELVSNGDDVVRNKPKR